LGRARGGQAEVGSCRLRVAGWQLNGKDAQFKQCLALLC
jgi:hypothetical protein